MASAMGLKNGVIFGGFSPISQSG